MIPMDERGKIIKNFIDDPSQELSFSVRKSIADEFEAKAESEGLATCTDNFLAWLARPQQRELTAALFVKI